MMEREEKQVTGKDYPKQVPPSPGKHYACELCHEKYELTEEQHRKVTCCGLPLIKTEEIIMSSPEPFGP